MEDATFTLHDLFMGLGGLGCFLGLVGGGYHLWLNSKLANIPKLWTARDQMDSKVEGMNRSVLERTHKLELRIAEQYVNKNDFSNAVERLEVQLRSLGKKLDRLLEGRGSS